MSHSKLQKIIRNNFGQLTIATAFCMSSPSFAGAGGSLMQTAPVLAPGQFEAKMHGDVILNNGGGFNLSPHLRIGLVEHYLDVDTFIGTGTIDFQVGALAKYNILPDINGQLGLSILFGFSFLSDNIKATNTTQKVALTTFGFLASKEVQAEFGTFSPYTALQVEAFVAKNDSRSPITLLGGVKWNPSGEKWNFFSELGINVHQSLWTISAGAAYPF